MNDEIRIVVQENGRIETDEYGEPRQYAVVVGHESLFLRTLPRSQYGASPKIMDVDTLIGVARIG
jgi:hypothetical protein